MKYGSVTVALAVLLTAREVGGEAVTVYRDEWGVPHVYAETEAGAAYGLGWAQAEDRLEQLLRNYRLAAGTMAEAFGPEWIEHDWRQRLVGHAEVCQRRYPELPAELRAMIEAFQAGVQAYMDAHPAEVPAWAPKLEPWQVPALGRYIIFGWPLGEAMAELERRGEVDLTHIPTPPSFPFSSNQWAVRPERTALGCAVLCIDPHIPWDGEFRFYEFRAHGGRFHVSGFGPLGAPILGLGHNEYLGWACTTGGPDTTDIYVEEVHPDNPLQYRYDGQWRDMEVQTIRIPVAGQEPVERELHRTHHGPLLLREGNRAYALACPYLSEIDVTTQLYRMGLARNLEEFRAAVGMNQLMSQNVMYADVEGHIFYVRTGRVPIRPPGFDFRRPVPGNTSRSEWLGIHPLEDLVQLLNPARGYMQNCNIGPDMMLVDSPLKAENYPAYLYGAGPGETNARGRRAVELLEQADRMTLEQAMAIVLDTHADGAEQWQAALAAAAKAWADEPWVQELRPALELLAEWNGRMDIDSAGATLYRALREMARGHQPPVDAEAIRRGEALDREQQVALLESLTAAAKHLQEQYGRLEVPWGEVHRIRRGEKSWPAAGGDSGGGQTLRAIGTSRSDDGIYYGRSGQSWTQLVLFRPGAVESYSATPYGQSDHPDSPHYTDQAEKLYSQACLKPTWFQRAALEGHIESTTTLTWAGGT